MLNETKIKTAVKDVHANFMGGPSYDLSPFARLYVMASSALFGEEGYYSSTRRTEKDDKMMEYLEERFGSFGIGMHQMMSGKTRAEAMRTALEESLAYDAELTLKFLGWLRKKALIRATPAAGLAVASHSEAVRGSGMLGHTAGNILSRLDDVTNCLAYYLDTWDCIRNTGHGERYWRSYWLFDRKWNLAGIGRCDPQRGKVRPHLHLL